MAALVDLAAMRDEVVKAGGDPKLIDAKCPADLVIDHCVSVPFYYAQRVLYENAHPPQIYLWHSLFLGQSIHISMH